MDFQVDIVKTASTITAVGAALTLLWRYVVLPLKKFTRTAKSNSDAIYNALPALLALSERWPSPSGPSSLIAELDRLASASSHGIARTMALFDLSGTPIYEASAEGRCTYVNKALTDLFEMDAHRMLGNGWLEGVASEDRARTFQTWRESVEKALPYDIEYSVRGVESRTLTPVHSISIPLSGPDGTTISYLVLVRPLTKNTPAR